jgi:outer membrane receptor protein involved in Fe transport
MIGGSALMALSAAPAFAADAPSTVQEVVVTGSRIPTPGLTSVSPLSVVNNQEVKLQGTTNTEDLLNNMPQVFATFGSMQSNGATGTATVDLRGLGTNRTLVLIDGKRVQPGDVGTGTAADLNQIPSSLIDRIEIVTGGASAVYGSDAVAGVVNFIMKKDFEGVRFDAEYKFDQHDQHDKKMQGLAAARGFAFPTGSITDGQTWQTTIAMGVNSPDGKGNITAYAGYQHLAPVLESHRDFSACALATFVSSSSQSCVGSSTSFPGRFQFTNQITGKNKSYTIAAGGTFRPYNGATDAFNFAPFNYFRRPDERYTGGYFAHYQVRPWADAYSTFMFMNDRTFTKIAPGGAFRGTGFPLATPTTPENSTFSVNCNNPLLTYNGVNGTGDLLCGPGDALGTASVDVNIGRRNVEGGTRDQDVQHISFRIVEGVKGDFADVWHYDIYGQYGQVNQATQETGLLSTTRLQNALQVVADPRPGPNHGHPVCKSVLSGTDANCVPYNIWSLGGVTAAALGYIQVPSQDENIMSEQIVHGDVGGDLGKYGVKSPWAKDGVGVSFGAEYRRETLVGNRDLESIAGDLNGNGTNEPVNGSFDVKEIFGEVRVPIVQDAQWAKDLTFEGGYRTSDYSSSGRVQTYKAALDWQVIDDIRFRGSYQRAVRAPNITELFTPTQFTLFGGQDKCAGPVIPANIAGCANTGAVVGPNLYNYGNIQACSAAQCATLAGGNPHLKPEQANTKSFGVVFTPTFLHGFTATLDWFDIQVNNEINSIPPKVALTECFDTGSPTFCSLIHRSPTDGEIQGNGYITGILENIGAFHTTGWDYEANYRINLADMGMGDHGSLVFHDVGTILDRFISEPVKGFGTYDCAGLYGTTCGTPNPKLRNVFRATWVSPWNFSLSMQWRYFGGVALDLNQSNAFLTGGAGFNDKFDAHIPAYNWFDLSGTWKIKDGYNLRFGVNNIFDKDPPIVDSSNVGISSPPFGNGNTYPQVYDALGRTIFIGLTADF